MAHTPAAPSAHTASREALRWEHKRQQSRSRWERDKHAADHAWPETLRLTWPTVAPTPASRDTTPPDTRPTPRPRTGVTRP